MGRRRAPRQPAPSRRVRPSALMKAWAAAAVWWLFRVLKCYGIHSCLRNSGVRKKGYFLVKK
jgi:hypothetical protein